MSDQNQTLRDDIAFMRGLAEEGRTGSLAGGSIMVASGLIFGAASFGAAYGVWSGIQTRQPLFFAEVWFGSALLFFLTLFLLRSRLRPQGGAGRAAGIAWSAAGWSIFTIVVSMVIMSVRTNQPWLMAALVPVILAIYGGAWFVGAVLAKMRWLHGVAFGSFVMAGVTAWFGTELVTLYLIYGVCLLVLMAIPGALLVRQGRTA